MSVYRSKIIKKHFVDFLNFYKLKFNEMDNQHISLYLLAHRNYPGTNTYNLIKKLYKKYSSKNKSIFELLEKRFDVFFKTMYDLYNFLQLKKLNGTKIVKLRHLLIDLQCWLLLNDIFEFDKISIGLLYDYVNSWYFKNYHVEQDIEYLVLGVDYYLQMLNYRNNFSKDIVDHLQINFKKSWNLKNSDNFLRYIIDPEIQLIFNLAGYSGLKVKTIINLQRNQIDFFHQVLSYRGYYSNKNLRLVYDYNIKQMLISSLNNFCESNFIYFARKFLHSEERHQYFLNHINFELINSRINHFDDDHLQSILNS